MSDSDQNDLNISQPSAFDSSRRSFQHAAAKVREFPQSPGVYLLKDIAGRVIYVGKAKNLRSRAGSYFQKGAEGEWRTADWVHEICDADFIECDSEVDALLVESRLIKDIQPKFNKDLKDDSVENIAIKSRRYHRGRRR